MFLRFFLGAGKLQLGSSSSVNPLYEINIRITAIQFYWVQCIYLSVLFNSQIMVGWLVSCLLAYLMVVFQIAFCTVCIVVTIATIMPLRDFEPYGIMFMIMCVFPTLNFLVIYDG
jgi:hypothetical protein